MALDGQLQGHRQEPRPPWLLTKGSRLGQTSKLHIWGSPGPAQVDGSPEGLGSLGKVQCRQFLFRCSGRMSTRSSCGGTHGAQSAWAGSRARLCHLGDRRPSWHPASLSGSMLPAQGARPSDSLVSIGLCCVAVTDGVSGQCARYLSPASPPPRWAGICCASPTPSRGWSFCWDAPCVVASLH